ncbi:MAG: hypothetical protein QOE32_870, partial [Pseudonocardiales bacterium]|nr:hypothetical protein [Pseudonocardiales bacterium]
TADDLAGVRSALSGPRVGPFLLDARISPAGYRHILTVSRG